MTDQPNIEMDAERDDLLELCVSIVETVRDMDHDAFELTDEEAQCNVFVLLQALLARRAVAPAPAGDVEQRVSDKVLAEYAADAQARVDGGASIGDVGSMALDLRDARAALSAMPSGRQRGLLEAAEIAESMVIERPEGPDWGLMDDAERRAFYDAQDQSRRSCDAIAKAIRAAAARLGEPDDGWLPIASAPKGKKVLVRCGASIDFAYQTDHQCELIDTWRHAGTAEHGQQLGYWPTHWKPVDLLPPTPSVPR